jgi:hypothetical protein
VINATTDHEDIRIRLLDHFVGIGDRLQSLEMQLGLATGFLKKRAQSLA